MNAIAALLGNQAGDVVEQPGARANSGDLLGARTPLLDANQGGSMVDDVVGLIDRFMEGR